MTTIVEYPQLRMYSMIHNQAKFRYVATFERALEIVSSHQMTQAD